MNKCKNCKSWVENDEVPSPYTHVCCNEKLNSDYNSEYTPDSVASYEMIAMGPDFGCIHWEAK